MSSSSTASFDRVVALVSVVILAVLMWFSASLYFENDIKRKLVREAQSGIEKLDIIISEVADTLHQLNNIPEQNCSKDLLIQMRRELFKSNFINDIGFIRNGKLVCTTGLGVLDNPIDAADSDYVSLNGFEVSVNHNIALFDNLYLASIARLKSYNAVIRDESLNGLVDNQFHWQLVYQDNGKNIHIVGEKGIFQPDNLSTYSNFGCSKKAPYCIGLLSDKGQLYKHYHQSLNLTYLLIICLSLIFYVLIRKQLRKYRSIKSRIRRGFGNDAFYCLYQPIVELRSGKIVGCEVLARYKDIQGHVYPDEFIPLINKLELTWSFTEKVILETLRDVELIAPELKGFKFNINFFAKDISSSQVLEILKLPELLESKVQLVIEITEDEKLSTRSSAKALKKLSDKGFLIAVDDFGTGYSNLKQLRDISCDTLKIDRSFISEMEDGSIRSTLIPHIVDIAKQLNLKIVAEGVENEMQRSALLDEGVEFAQGWLFGKAMPMAELLALIKKQEQEQA
ncbi:EAL domain-containing protein [Psychrosphaera sp. B3R10]|uniref:EAL domain-containing protein n=1 Tax=unclassified Psychrosphaera TaxID=2641570 RepID=UPI001C0A2B9A|nr:MULTISPECIES: EAL domain-containing protein [unclassified Psychrosphaera]MBU2880436.1 EAL domain-containing protein [Psychrosphaera sp. I2R16]MBU2991463.1 EAL domain-containing protein [Psychrosphaera sp. B3R10]